MLSPVTKEYVDKSTLQQFSFGFYCDCCKRELSTTGIPYHSGFPKKLYLSREEREARAMIYAAEHGKAYERANNEVRLELNRCEICGDMVCENCSIYTDSGVYCRKCAGKEMKK